MIPDLLSLIGICYNVFDSSTDLATRMIGLTFMFKQVTIIVYI